MKKEFREVTRTDPDPKCLYDLLRFQDLWDAFNAVEKPTTGAMP